MTRRPVLPSPSESMSGSADGQMDGNKLGAARKSLSQVPSSTLARQRSVLGTELDLINPMDPASPTGGKRVIPLTWCICEGLLTTISIGVL
jgi:hypothetical protein